MEATYHRELNKTWMTLGEECECEEFALRILQENHLEGLMPVFTRRIDGELKYCFEISRGKSLARVLEKRSITTREIREILFALDRVIGRLEEYLLDLDHLMLEPELIYTAPDISHLLFCCHPAAKKNFFDQLRDLIQYFLNKTDYLEERGVETAYALFQVCQQEYFRFDDLLSVVGREKTETGREETAKPDRPEKNGEDAPDFRMEPEEKRRACLPAASVIAGTGAILLLLFSLLRQATGQVFEIKWILGGGLLLLLAAGLAFRERKNAGMAEWETDVSEDFPRDPPLSEEQPAKPEASAWPGDSGEKIRRGHEDQAGLEEGAATEILSENFRLLTRERVLISENSGQYETIRMVKMPFIIGKLPGASDFALKQSTISRIHARLEQQGNEFFLTDCNSTNGTCINGIRLEPNRRYPLREGDEVEFADLKYIFQ